MEYCSLCGGEGSKQWQYPCGKCGQTGVIPCP
jgi:DnaJ-class molecular chaperone